MKQGLDTKNVYIINSLPGETVPLSVTSTSSYVTFGSKAAAKNYDLIVQNAGTKTAFFALGTAAAGVTAVVPASSNNIGTTTTGNCTPILGGAIYTFQKNTDATNIDTIAAICGGSDTTTLYFTSIQGS